MVAAALGLSCPATGLALPTGSAATSGAQMQGAHVESWGRVEVAATPEQTFKVLTDYERMKDFLPGMLTSKVIVRDGNRVVVEQSADEGVLLFRQRVDARLAIDEAPPYRLTIRALSGSFKELTSHYVLTRRRDRTLIEYRSRFLPDFHMPAMIGIHAVQRSLERHLAALAEEVNRRAAVTGSGRVPASGADAPASAPPEPAPKVPRGE